MLRSLAVLAAVAVLALPAGPAGALGLIRDAEIERTLDRISAPILGAAGLSPSTVEILIVNDRSLNAFVAAGRNIFIHTGLLMKLESAEALGGVIAHEAGHIAGGHMARRAIGLRNARGPALIGVLLGIAAGAAGGGEVASAIIGGSAGALQRQFLAHSRAEEASADQAALGYLARAGMGASGLLDVMQMFRGQEVFSAGNRDPYVLTHPLSSERVQLIERRAAETAGMGANADLNYWTGRMRAKLRGFIDVPERVLDQIEGEPETEETLYAKAVALHRLGDLRGSVVALDRLLATRPADPFYTELKGQVLFESGQAEAALPFYRRAVQLAPGEPLIGAGLGRVLLALNTPATDAEALHVLEAARAADDADPTALRDLAVAYQRAGDEGMATLATAERFALSGRIEDAQLHADRAATILPSGSPGWLRAQDILNMKAE